MYNTDLLVLDEEEYIEKKIKFLDQIRNFGYKLITEMETSFWGMEEDTQNLSESESYVIGFLLKSTGEMRIQENKILLRFSKKSREDKFLNILRWLGDSEGEI